MLRLILKKRTVCDQMIPPHLEVARDFPQSCQKISGWHFESGQTVSFHTDPVFNSSFIIPYIKKYVNTYAVIKKTLQLNKMCVCYRINAANFIHVHDPVCRWIHLMAMFCFSCMTAR